MAVGRFMKHLSPGALLVIVVTLVLFVGAVISKGMTHDLLLEGAVFLVSVKLIMMSYRNYEVNENVQNKLDRIHAELVRANICCPPGGGGEDSPLNGIAK